MLDNKYFGSYYPTNSIMHKLNPIIKLINFVLFIIIMLLSSSFKLHLVILFFIIMITYMSKVPLKFYIDMIFSLRYIYIILLFILAYNGFNQDTIILLIIKTTSIVLYLAIIFYTTSISELKYSIERLLLPLKLININLNKLSTIIINIIYFFPLFQTTKKEIIRSASSRGLDYYNSDLITRYYIEIKLFKNILRITNQKIKEIKIISNTFTINKRKLRTNYRTNRVGLLDIIILLIHLYFMYNYIVEAFL